MFIYTRGDTLEVYILAVTKAYDKFCVAGLTADGRWVRPIPNEGDSRFWTERQLTSKRFGFTQVGDVWRIEGHAPNKYQYTNHSEDFITTDRKLIERLSNDELIKFIEDTAEDQNAFNDTVNARGRSLCLVKVTSFKSYRDEINNRAFMKFINKDFNVDNPKTATRRYRVKDCKWESLVLQGKHPNITFEEVYLCIGLATPAPYDGVEYPQVIGLHTKPEVLALDTYPH